MQKTVLFWGRTDLSYSRHRVILDLFTFLGWKAAYFHPVNSKFGLLQSIINPPKRPDLIFVPCFRHSDIGSASFWAKKWHIPLVVDPFISSYAKKVLERKRWSIHENRAKKLKKWEADLLQIADVVIADTSAHAAFFSEELGVDPQKIVVIYVGAEDELFQYHPFPESGLPFDILFYGSYLTLHGVETIIRASSLCGDLNATWTLLGDKGLSDEIAQNPSLHNVSYEPWSPYDKLPDRISKAHIVLGIFGSSFQAGRVIPNKVFQAMAVGRPVITRYSPAYNDSIGYSDSIGWVEPENAESLAALVRQWLEKPEDLPERGKQTRSLYEQFFAREKLCKMLEITLKKVGLE